MNSAHLWWCIQGDKFNINVFYYEHTSNELGFRTLAKYLFDLKLASNIIKGEF